MPVALRLPDPEGTYTAVRLSSDVSGEPFRREGDDWVLELELPDVLRLEYKLEVTRADGGSEWILDPGNPKRAPGAFGEKSVLELPGYEAPAWLGPRPSRGASTRRRSAGAGSARRRDARLEPGRRRAGDAAADAAGQRRPRVRRALPAHPLQRREDRRRRAAAAPGRAARARRPQPVVLAPRPPTRACWLTTSCPRCATRSASIGAPAAMGASLGGLAMLHAQRALPAHVRRRCSCSPAASSCRATTRTRAASSRYARIIRFVRETLRDGAVRDPRPGDDHRRARGGERAQQSRNGACPGRTGVRRVPGGGAGHAQLRRLAGCLRPAPDRAAADGRGRDERTNITSSTRTRSAPPAPSPSYGHYGRAAARVPVRGRPAPTTGTTTA